MWGMPLHFSPQRFLLLLGNRVTGLPNYQTHNLQQSTNLYLFHMLTAFLKFLPRIKLANKGLFFYVTCTNILLFDPRPKDRRQYIRDPWHEKITNSYHNYACQHTGNFCMPVLPFNATTQGSTTLIKRKEYS